MQDHIVLHRSDGSTYVFNRDNGRWLFLEEESTDPNELLRQLNEEEAQIFYNSKLIQPDSMSGPSIFSIRVGDRCNLNCVYCYNNSSREGEIADEGELHSILRYITECYPMKRKQIIMHGGEPMLAWQAIEPTIRVFHEETIHWTIQTNGTILTKRMIDVFRQYSISISISVDGDRHIHNKQRGQFDTIMTNLRELTESQVPLGIIVTITKHNVASIKGIIEMLVNRGITTFSVQSVLDTGRADKTMVVDLQERARLLRDLLAVSYDLYRKGKRIDIREANTLITYLNTNLRDYICINSEKHCGKSMLAINYNGGIYPCDLLMDDAFQMGHINGRSLNIDLNGTNQNQVCLNCPLYQVCYGYDSCTAEKLYNVNGVEVLQDWHECPLFHVYLDEIRRISTDTKYRQYIEENLSRRYGDA